MFRNLGGKKDDRMRKKRNVKMLHRRTSGG